MSDAATDPLAATIEESGDFTIRCGDDEIARGWLDGYQAWFTRRPTDPGILHRCLVALAMFLAVEATTAEEGAAS